MSPKPSPIYDAFISYGQGPDSRIAAAIQEGLARMARRWEELSSLRVFRDATSLAVGSLEESLRKALESSRYLIVIASQRSAASDWVQNEIRMFLEHHPPENLLIVLTEGELTFISTDGRFVLDGKTPFPNLETSVFHAEPVYVDLRWARYAKDLNIGNAKFLDALASLASTLSSVPKDQIISTVVTDLRRLRRNQQINLGFRGLIGFGVMPLLMIIWAGLYGFSSAAVLASKVHEYATFLAGFLLTGIAGALILGTGWRGVIGFGFGFLWALPLYMIGSLQPFQNRATDLVALALVTVASFALAGAAGGYLTKDASLRRGAVDFSVGGIVAAALFLIVPDLRPQGIRTFIAEGPWLSDRIIIAASRAVEACGNVFDDRSYPLLFPLLLGAGVSGTLFGIGVARRRIQIPSWAKRFRIIDATVVRSTWRILKIACLVAGVVAAILGIPTLTDGYQTRKALAELKAVNLSSSFPIEGEHLSDDSWIDAFVISLRARKALDRLGNRAAAAEFSNFVSKWIEQFGRTPANFAASRYAAMPGPDPIASVAETIREFGRPEELERLITLAHDSARSSSAEVMAAVARTESSFGSKTKALELLGEAELKLTGRGMESWYDRSLVAEGFYEAGDVERSRYLLTDLFDVIEQSAKGSPGLTIGLRDFLAPSSGNAIWGTEVWEHIGSLRDEIGDAATNAVAAMCRAGRLSEAVATVNGAGSGNTAFLHVQERLAHAAAQAGKFEVAFGILDGCRKTTSRGWTDYDDEAAALVDIIQEAQRTGGKDVKAAALERLKRILDVVRKPNPDGAKMDRFTGMQICRGFAAARDFSAGGAAVDQLTENQWEGYEVIGTALAESGDSRRASRALRLAWKQFHLHYTLASSVSPSFLSAVGQGLAKAGDLRAARYVAEDIGSDFEHYTGDQELISKLFVYVSILEASRE